MKELKGIFKPEVSPIHTRNFSIATNIVLTLAERNAILNGEGVLKAGTILYSKGAGLIKDAPEAGATHVKGASVASAVLMHDVNVDKYALEYQVGAMITGVVYDDIMAEVNSAWATEKADIETNGIAIYAVKTK